MNSVFLVPKNFLKFEPGHPKYYHIHVNILQYEVYHVIT